MNHDEDDDLEAYAAEKRQRARLVAAVLVIALVGTLVYGLIEVVFRPAPEPVFRAPGVRAAAFLG